MLGPDPARRRPTARSCCRSARCRRRSASLGGFVAGPRADWSTCSSTGPAPYIFTTALSPGRRRRRRSPRVGVLRSPEGDALRARLRAPRRPAPPRPPVARSSPVVLGERGRRRGRRRPSCSSQGLLVPAIRPPTVAPGTAACASRCRPPTPTTRSTARPALDALGRPSEAGRERRPARAAGRSWSAPAPRSARPGWPRQLLARPAAPRAAPSPPASRPSRSTPDDRDHRRRTCSARATGEDPHRRVPPPPLVPGADGAADGGRRARPRRRSPSPTWSPSWRGPCPAPDDRPGRDRRRRALAPWPPTATRWPWPRRCGPTGSCSSPTPASARSTACASPPAALARWPIDGGAQPLRPRRRPAPPQPRLAGRPRRPRRGRRRRRPGRADRRLADLRRAARPRGTAGEPAPAGEISGKVVRGQGQRDAHLGATERRAVDRAGRRRRRAPSWRAMSSPSPVEPAALSPRRTSDSGSAIPGPASSTTRLDVITDPAQPNRVRRVPSGVWANTLPSEDVERPPPASAADSRTRCGPGRAHGRTTRCGRRRRPGHPRTSARSSDHGGQVAPAHDHASCSGRRALRISSRHLRLEPVDVGDQRGGIACPSARGGARSAASAAGATGRRPAPALRRAARRCGRPAG